MSTRGCAVVDAGVASRIAPSTYHTSSFAAYIHPRVQNERDDRRPAVCADRATTGDREVKTDDRQPSIDRTATASSVSPPRWREVREAILGRLRAREVDWERGLDDLDRRLRERRDRAPSPERGGEGSERRAAGGLPAKPGDMTGFRAINAPEPPAAGRSAERSAAGQDRQAGPRARPSRSRSRSRSATTSPTPMALPDQDFPVVRIKDTRSVHGVTERLVEWGATRHPASWTAAVGIREGRAVAGTRWRVRTMARVRDGSPGGDEVTVTWYDTWEPDWELPRKAVAAHERVRRPATDPTMAWWEWPEHPDGCLAAEEGSERGARTPVDGDDLWAARGCDYTTGFLELVRAELTAPAEEQERTPRRWPLLPVATARQYLNMRVRQGLKFRDSFAGRRFRLASPNDVRAALVQVFGYARATPCTHCRAGGGPFSKCVAWPGAARGACANCSYDRVGRMCEHHAEAFRSGGSCTTGSHSSPGPSSRARKASTPPNSPSPPGSPSPSRSPSPLPCRKRRVNEDANRDAQTEKRDEERDDEDRDINRDRTDSHDRGRGGGDDDDDDDPRPTKRARWNRQAQPELPHCADATRRTDPEAGRATPAGLEVLQGETFAPGAATDAQVDAVVSRCSCTQAAALHDAWRRVRAAEERTGRPEEERWASRQRYWAWEWAEELNAVVRTRGAWAGAGEVVDLTGE